MISIDSSFISAVSTVKSVNTGEKMTDRSVVATWPLGFSAAFNGTAPNGSVFIGTGLSGNSAVLPVSPLGGMPVRERTERPTKALEAVAAAAKARAYACAATSAEAKRQTKHQTKQQHHTMWAFRGLEPWSDPA
ncbi:hypothetical protein ACIHCQ_06215 [Streptomyces sp. NPDC052236]|uniref:hypothetical protein n=1 Tax=Streptomyces sp. NPDC052236 TaxID=3365686 RepID=UPI0037D1F10C